MINENNYGVFMEKEFVRDLTMRLPNGDFFSSFEKETLYTNTLYVDYRNKDDKECDGSKHHPFGTIQDAADIASPGTKVLISGGEYREFVHPENGGTDAGHMICYEAVDGEKVNIKASISVPQKDITQSTGWSKYPHGFESPQNDYPVYKIELNPSDFQGYNPFLAVNILHDRLFIEYEKTDMTPYLCRRGMIFCDDKPLKQVSLYNQMAESDGTYFVEANGMTVHFRLPKDDKPENHLIELTCREQCFAPVKPFLSYIKVKGITFSHAATGAPVPQRGALSALRGHHWIIEDCTINWSNCVGIDIGNECWHHEIIKNQLIGYSIIRNCEIKDCGVCGIAGLFATNLLIEDNFISGTGWQKMELSWEAGGMKVHNCHNSLIRRNIFTKTIRADHLWMDCDNQNNRITQNLFLDGIEQREAIFIECTRNGINLIDHNIFWNIEGRFNPKDIPNEPGSTGWYKQIESDDINGYAVYGEGTDRLHIVHNLIGKVKSSGYFAKPVSFRIVGNTRGGTSRNALVANNMFYECGEAAIKFPTKDNSAVGNVYANMPGGYLRILYPAPEVCLDLESWQTFYGFDKEGADCRLNIDLDTERLTLRISEARQEETIAPWDYPDRFIDNPSEIANVSRDCETDTDFFGKEVFGEKRLPGPFTEIEEGKEIDIDPRKNKRSCDDKTK